MDLDRLHKSVRVTRMLAWVVVAVCGLMALALAPGLLVAWRLGEWTALLLGIAAMVLLASVVGATLGLLRRQRRILQAGETLRRLQDEASADATIRSTRDGGAG